MIVYFDDIRYGGLQRAGVLPVGCIKGSDTMDGNDQSGALTHERDIGVIVAYSPMQLPPLVCLKYDDLIYVIWRVKGLRHCICT